MITIIFHTKKLYFVKEHLKKTFLNYKFEKKLEKFEDIEFLNTWFFLNGKMDDNFCQFFKMNILEKIL